MATCSHQTLIADAGCLNNLFGFQLEVIKTRLLCQILTSLNPVATCDPQTILNEAGCLKNLTQFELSVIQAQLLCNVSAAIVGGLPTGNQFHGNGDPNGVQVGSPPDLYIQDDEDGRIWSKTSGVGTSTGWV